MVPGSSGRGVRAAGWALNAFANAIGSYCRFTSDPSGFEYATGFRVASDPTGWDVPEPTSITLALAGGLCLLAYAWRRRHV